MKKEDVVWRFDTINKNGKQRLTLVHKPSGKQSRSIMLTSSIQHDATRAENLMEEFLRS